MKPVIGFTAAHPLAERKQQTDREEESDDKKGYDYDCAHGNLLSYSHT
jgi:hypothetical protein